MLQCLQRRMKSENLVQCMMADMSACIRKFINQEIIISDILPCLMDIIQPSFRPVSYSNTSTIYVRFLNSDSWEKQMLCLLVYFLLIS